MRSHQETPKSQGLLDAVSNMDASGDHIKGCGAQGEEHGETAGRSEGRGVRRALCSRQSRCCGRLYCSPGCPCSASGANSLLLPFFCCFCCFCFLIFKLFQEAIFLQPAVQIQDLQLKHLGDPFLSLIPALGGLQLSSGRQTTGRWAPSTYSTSPKNRSRPELPRLQFDVLQILLLFQEKVVFLGQLRFQFQDPLLGGVQPLTLLEQEASVLL